MDEPLSNLDAKLRVQMRSEISRLQRHLGTTTMYVTHDQVEAMTMGDRVAVIKRGLLQQVDEPQDLYDHPDNVFVAQFIGSPSMNVLKATLEQRGEAIWVVVGGGALELSAEALAAHPGLRNYVYKELAFGARPEHLVDPSLESSTDSDTYVEVRSTSSSRSALRCSSTSASTPSGFSPSRPSSTTRGWTPRRSKAARRSSPDSTRGATRGPTRR